MKPTLHRPEGWQLNLPETDGGENADKSALPQLGTYQVKTFQHTRLQGLEKQANDWLKGYDWNIARVLSAEHSKVGSFHYMTILYSEKAVP